MTIPKLPLSPIEIAPVLDYLKRHMPGYPFDEVIDPVFVEELLDDFDHLDVLEQIKLYRWFHNNRPPTERSRLAIRRWLAAAKPRNRY